jgi:hypothetical protein
MNIIFSPGAVINTFRYPGMPFLGSAKLGVRGGIQAKKTGIFLTHPCNWLIFSKNFDQ